MGWRDTLREGEFSAFGGNTFIEQSLIARAPNYDWTPAITAAHKQSYAVYGVPWIDNRGSPQGALNAIISFADQSGATFEPVAPELLLADAARIQRIQNPPEKGGLFGGNLGIIGAVAAVVAAIYTAGASLAVEAGIAAGAEAGALAGTTGAEIAIGSESIGEYAMADIFDAGDFSQWYPSEPLTPLSQFDANTYVAPSDAVDLNPSRFSNWNEQVGDYINSGGNQIPMTPSTPGTGLWDKAASGVLRLLGSQKSATQAAPNASGVNRNPFTNWLPGNYNGKVPTYSTNQAGFSMATLALFAGAAFLLLMFARK